MLKLGKISFSLDQITMAIYWWEAVSLAFKQVGLLKIAALLAERKHIQLVVSSTKLTWRFWNLWGKILLWQDFSLQGICFSIQNGWPLWKSPISRSEKMAYHNTKSYCKVEWTGALNLCLYASSIYVIHGWLDFHPSMSSGSSKQAAMCIQP